eukprot:scaffold22582_cov194-Cylindrotheca_fusiformis.AAC.5
MTTTAIAVKPIANANQGPDPSEGENVPAVTWHTSWRKMEEEERQELGRDVYSLIFVAPLRGRTFYFALYVILLKLLLFK